MLARSLDSGLAIAMKQIGAQHVRNADRCSDFLAAAERTDSTWVSGLPICDQ
jgi:hypothetical protein